MSFSSIKEAKILDIVGSIAKEAEDILSKNANVTFHDSEEEPRRNNTLFLDITKLIEDELSKDFPTFISQKIVIFKNKLAKSDKKSEWHVCLTDEKNLYQKLDLSMFLKLAGMELHSTTYLKKVDSYIGSHYNVVSVSIPIRIK